MTATHRTTFTAILIGALAAILPARALAEFHGYDFNHDSAPGHQQPGYEYVDKYVYFDGAVPGSFGWRRSGITSNTHGSTADNGPPGLYEVYYDSNNSWNAATFSTNLGDGVHQVTLYWGRGLVGGVPSFSFLVTFEDTATVTLTCGDNVTCEYTRAVDVTDGTLDIRFDHIDSAWWMISGIGIDLQSATSAETMPPGRRLSRSAPNPFRNRTRIEFELDEPGPVLLDVFTVAGVRIATLVDRELGAGVHRVPWSGRDSHGRMLPDGVYFYRLEAGGRREIGKTVLVN